MTAKALLEDEPGAVPRRRSCHGLEGNLCRCTGYEPIVEAVLDAAKAMAVAEPRVSGTSRPARRRRREGHRPRQVRGRPRRCPARPTARRALRPARDDRRDRRGRAAEATSRACSRSSPRRPSADPRALRSHQSRPPGDRGRQGPVPRRAGGPRRRRDAARRREALPGSSGSSTRTCRGDRRRRGAGDGAPILHPSTRAASATRASTTPEATRSQPICARDRAAWGDIDAAFADADLVIEGEYRYPMCYAYAMEPYSGGRRGKAPSPSGPPSTRTWSATTSR